MLEADADLDVHSFCGEILAWSALDESLGPLQSATLSWDIVRDDLDSDASQHREQAPQLPGRDQSPADRVKQIAVPGSMPDSSLQQASNLRLPVDPFPHGASQLYATGYQVTSHNGSNFSCNTNFSEPVAMQPANSAPLQQLQPRQPRLTPRLQVSQAGQINHRRGWLHQSPQRHTVEPGQQQQQEYQEAYAQGLQPSACKRASVVPKHELPLAACRSQSMRPAMNWQSLRASPANFAGSSDLPSSSLSDWLARDPLTKVPADAMKQSHMQSQSADEQHAAVSTTAEHEESVQKQQQRQQAMKRGAKRGSRRVVTSSAGPRMDVPFLPESHELRMRHSFPTSSPHTGMYVLSTAEKFQPRHSLPFSSPHLADLSECRTCRSPPALSSCMLTNTLPLDWESHRHGHNPALHPSFEAPVQAFERTPRRSSAMQRLDEAFQLSHRYSYASDWSDSVPCLEVPHSNSPGKANQHHLISLERNIRQVPSFAAPLDGLQSSTSQTEGSPRQQVPDSVFPEMLLEKLPDPTPLHALSTDFLDPSGKIWPYGPSSASSIAGPVSTQGSDQPISIHGSDHDVADSELQLEQQLMAWCAEGSVQGSSVMSPDRSLQHDLAPGPEVDMQPAVPLPVALQHRIGTSIIPAIAAGLAAESAPDRKDQIRPVSLPDKAAQAVKAMHVVPTTAAGAAAKPKLVSPWDSMDLQQVPSMPDPQIAAQMTVQKSAQPSGTPTGQKRQRLDSAVSVVPEKEGLKREKMRKKAKRDALASTSRLVNMPVDGPSKASQQLKALEQINLIGLKNADAKVPVCLQYWSSISVIMRIPSCTSSC